MGFEIEHKYLVKSDSYKASATASFHIIQGYLSRDPERTVRIRIKNESAYITVKGKTYGVGRLEYEYEIPKGDALEMLELCVPPILEKIRYIVPFRNHIWEVDEFFGDQKGLILAEIELISDEDEYTVPDFIGEDVTGNPLYYNSNL